MKECNIAMESTGDKGIPGASLTRDFQIHVKYKKDVDITDGF
ncbi:hypothetical protein SAMN02910400_02643 [Lachnospiraceae bacterium C10]|nr:hypothetical protein SAMN02910400_02643 [Lachnospiraceae bacterium C10]